MGYKNNDRCLDKAADDEPIFVLRSQDRHSIDTVRFWLNRAEPTLSHDRYMEAAEHIRTMEAWQRANPERVKNPD